MNVLVLIGALLGGTQAVSRPVVLNAIYALDQELIPTFGIYYGLKSLQMIRFEFDLTMQKIIAKEDVDYTMEGVECSAEYGCEMTDMVEYVTDTRAPRMFVTNQSYLPLKLPQTTDAEGDPEFRLKFNLYRGGKTKVRNVIGLGAKSLFWPYIAQHYGKACFTVTVNTDFQMRNAAAIWDQIDRISTKITFFSSNDMVMPSYREQVTDNLGFSAVRIIYAGFGPVVREPTFNFNQPHFLRLIETDFNQLLREVKNEICPVFDHCQTANDMYGNLSGKPKLSFFFSQSDDFQTKSPFRIDVSLADLVFVDEEQKIGFNFAQIPPEQVGQKTSMVELGLLFLNRVTLDVTYHSGAEDKSRLFLTISDKQLGIKPVVFWTYLGVSALLSVIIVMAIGVGMRGAKPNSSSSYSNSLL